MYGSIVNELLLVINYMKKTIVVYAHPNKNGFCGKILAQTLLYLKEQNVDFDLFDLYEIEYDPVLKKQEHYTSGGYDVSDENKKIQQMITDAKNMIFIYPVWWQNMPAILKGFIDRVFTSRFGFTYQNNIPIGLLKGRKAVAIVTSGGPRAFEYLYAHDRAVTILTKDALRFCGFKTRGYVIGSARELNEKKMKEIDRKVQKALKFLQ